MNNTYNVGDLILIQAYAIGRIKEVTEQGYYVIPSYLILQTNEADKKYKYLNIESFDSNGNGFVRALVSFSSAARAEVPKEEDTIVVRANEPAAFDELDIYLKIRVSSVDSVYEIGKLRTLYLDLLRNKRMNGKSIVVGYVIYAGISKRTVCRYREDQSLAEVFINRKEEYGEGRLEVTTLITKQDFDSAIEFYERTADYAINGCIL